MRKKHSIGILLILIIFSGCTTKEMEIGEYYQYLVNPKNGLLKSKVVEPFKISVRFLPSSYFIYKEYKNVKKSSEELDSIKQSYNGNYTFLLRIAPDVDGGHVFDVMTQTVPSVTQYKNRVRELNFEMQQQLILKIGEKTYTPVLVELENTYELTKHRNFLIAYALPDIVNTDYEQIDFVYQDQIFGTGIHHFLFDQQLIENTPTIKF